MRSSPVRPLLRRLGVGLAGVSLAATAAVGVAPSPAGAAATDSDTLVFVPFNGQTLGTYRNGAGATTTTVRTDIAVEGDFSASPGTEILLYNPGPDPDRIVAPVPSGTGVTTTVRTVNVNGSFQPLVGDFDGNAIDDVFWYAPGSSPDFLWRFAADGSYTSTSLPVNGDYVPTVIEADGDGYDDIVWYASGTAPDSIWLFGSGATKTSKAISINGSYRLIPGYFGDAAEGSPQKRLLFFNAAGPDSIWTFDTSADHTSSALPNIDGAFRPIVGRFVGEGDNVLWYRPGSASERFWSFDGDGSLNLLEPPNVSGTYDPAVGDLDGNGWQDIAWVTNGRATIWRFNGGGYSQVSYDSGLPNTIPAVAFTDPFDLG